MPYRQFEDAQGHTWDVWEVRPSAGKRSTTDPKAPLEATLALGWLCFERAGEKRRLAPIPNEWESLSDGELVDLSLSGDLVKPRSRVKRIGEGDAKAS
ncbi:MAG: hypothetical protein JWO05_2597 [Gemmatimonadetes bacterium]|nr:hypothetical protein [Gemmatimonadota bacterium]